MELLSLIARGQGSKTKDLIAQVGISRREYYGRMSKFLNTDLIVRRHIKRHLSKFGLVIYGVVTILVKEINVTELTR